MPDSHGRPILALIVAALVALSFAAGCGDDDDDGTTLTEVTTTADVDAEICSTLTTLQGEVDDVKQLDSSDVNANVIINEVDKLTSTVDQLATEAKQSSNKIKKQVTAAAKQFKTTVGDIPDQSVPEGLITLGRSVSALESSLKDISSEAGCS